MSSLEHDDWSRLDEPPENAAILRNISLLNEEPHWSNLENLRSLRQQYPIVRHPPNKWCPEMPKEKCYDGGWRQVLAGETHLHERPTDDRNAEPEECRKSNNIWRGFRCGPGSLHLWYDTGADLEKFKQEKPREQYKFYLSLYLNTPQRHSCGQDFLEAILRECRERKLTITTKSFEHNYDGLIIYTWHPREMADVFRKLYRTYKDLFSDVPRVFQGEVQEILPGHIGWAREPIGGWKGGSHSGRMARLGGYLDSVDHTPRGDTVTEENFVAACEVAGVRPEAPWLLDVDDPVLRGPL